MAAASFIMNTSTIRIVAAFVLLVWGAGDALADSPVKFSYDPKKTTRTAAPVYYTPPAKLGGIVPRAAAMRKPLVLISPFADAKYGYGRGMVSWDRRSGKPKGFIFGSVKFW